MPEIPSCSLTDAVRRVGSNVTLLSLQVGKQLSALQRKNVTGILSCKGDSTCICFIKGKESCLGKLPSVNVDST